MNPLNIIVPVDPPDVIHKRREVYLNQATLGVEPGNRRGLESPTKYVDKFLALFENALDLLVFMNRNVAFSWSGFSRSMVVVYPDHMDLYWDTVRVLMHATCGRYSDDWDNFIAMDELIPRLMMEANCDVCGQHINAKERPNDITCELNKHPKDVPPLLACDVSTDEDSYM